MFIGNFYLALPNSFPSLSMTTYYFVLFSIMVFFISRPFRALLRPYVLLVADIIFIYSFGINDLVAILLISLFGYVIASILKKYHNKIILISSIILLIGLLAFYKYSGFILNRSFIMPLGLSFYSFKIISYLIDIYKGKFIHEYNPLYYFNYILFFPCITSGPINRAKAFIEELKKPTIWDYKEAKAGGLQMVLGIFEKIVFCDFVALWVSAIFEGESIYGTNLIIGIFLYAIQIYLDFDAISNIAIGSARLFGFKLDKNFNSPYLAYSLKDFWRRWHISLSSWLRDYIYIPLGGKRKGTFRKYLNLIITFIFSGAWHGASINYLLWGLGHALVQIVEDLISKVYKKLDLKVSKVLIYIGKILGTIVNFIIVSFLFLIFRFTDFNRLLEVINNIGISQSFDYSLLGMTSNQFIWLIIILAIVLVFDILRDKFDLAYLYGELTFPIRWMGYVLFIVIFMIFGVYGGSFNPSDFIYQFF